MEESGVLTGPITRRSCGSNPTPAIQKTYRNRNNLIVSRFNFSMKGTILSAKNDSSFLWYRLKPEILSLKHIDDIRYSFDEYKEPKADYNLKDKYEKLLPLRFGYHDQDKVYAIMICEANSINYILIKSHPLFDKVEKMIQRKFKFITRKKSN